MSYPGYPTAPGAVPPAQYQAVQYQPPVAPPQYGQPPAPVGYAAPPAGPQAPATPPPAPAAAPASLPGWDQLGGGGGLPYLDFDNHPREWLGGLVIEVSPARQVTNFTTKAAEYHKLADGRDDLSRPKTRYPLTLMTADRDPALPGDDGRRRVSIQSFMIAPVSKALAANGRANLGPEVGASLFIMRTVVHKERGADGQPAKHHEWGAHYVPATDETRAQAAAIMAASAAAVPTQPPVVPTTAAPAAPVYGQPPAPAYVDPAQPQFPGQVVPAAPVAQDPAAAFAAFQAQQAAAMQAQTAPAVPPAPPGVDPAQWAAFQAAQQPAAAPVGQPSAWTYGQPSAPGAPVPPPPGVPAPPAAGQPPAFPGFPTG